ncbi:uncharacterized protein CCOS01_05857 [Colletotrichum costaricense]|uniref:AAA+ ATPase domain-containing protein n=1 Tax=Colletotrichum costaricense TaxID=1209916 RepID=A0AAI9Z0Y3_9PEZI|nr:uncharacterized protein CCOS01_05857 [Colletotrichum costaricense]KAK1530754.1 hypothetical protein CCOS01_05857 [Colletotrichum costaricense]
MSELSSQIGLLDSELILAMENIAQQTQPDDVHHEANVNKNDTTSTAGTLHPSSVRGDTAGFVGETIANTGTILDVDQGVHAGLVTVSARQYRDLISKISELEQKLAQVDDVVDKVVEKRIFAAPLNKRYGFDVTGYDEIFGSNSTAIQRDFSRMIMRSSEAIEELGYVLGTYRRYWTSHQVQGDKNQEDKDEEAEKHKIVETTSDESLLAAEMLTDAVAATALQTTWEVFQSQNSGSINTIVNPIQLVVGEPELSFRGIFNNFIQEPDRKLASRSLPPKASANKTLGESPLPERILIHSPEIMKALSEACEDSFIGRQSTTFLRPFKMFTYYEQTIRDHAAKLEVSYASNANVTSEAEPVTPVETKHTSEGDSGELAKSEEASSVLPQDEADLKCPITLLHIRCLTKLLDDTVCTRREYLASTECEKITFSDIWYLFQPGEEVIDQANKQAYRVLRVSMPKHKVIPPYLFIRNSNSENAKEKPAIIQCLYIDFDGENLGPVTKTFEIPRFDTDKPIKSLPIYPLRMIREDGFRERLMERGKMLWDVIQVKPMYYKGNVIDTRQDADSQVMIDFTEALAYAHEHNKDWKPKVDFISTSTEESKTDDTTSDCDAICCRGQYVFDDSFVEDSLTEDFIAKLFPQSPTERRSLIIYPHALKDLLESKSTPGADELVIMSYRVFGFLLRNRQWAQLDLTYLKGENEDSRTSALDAFERLVLPEGHKEMVKSLVTQHFRDKKAREKMVDRNPHADASSDLIRGKGQGLIILLHGAPGVGKTTTAEGMAETFKKPLFQVTCGDLGTTASTVQTELEKNFTLASRWDCILLLDEAEVFLASRERKDLTRNGLVAIFLRVLEYYTGILFLTTNRVGDFDEAFASRIHMSLYYPKLDLDKTLDVFRLNFDLIKNRFDLRRRKIFLDEDSIIDFAKKHFESNGDDKKQGLRWNGRQIRNACQTALAMAEFDALNSDLRADIDPSPFVHLRLDHFRIIEKAYDEFAIYLGDVYGANFDERAAENKIR